MHMKRRSNLRLTIVMTNTEISLSYIFVGWKLNNVPVPILLFRYHALDDLFNIMTDHSFT